MAYGWIHGERCRRWWLHTNPRQWGRWLTSARIRSERVEVSGPRNGQFPLTLATGVGTLKYRREGCDEDRRGGQYVQYAATERPNGSEVPELRDGLPC